MKLNILPARHGLRWISQSVSLIKKQPLGLTGIFALLLTLGMVLSLFPLIGPFFSLTIWPTVSLCMMIAAQKVESGHFPMPSLLAEVVRAGTTQKRSLLILGLLYALLVMIVLGLIGASSGEMMATMMKAQSDPEAAKKLMASSTFLPTVFGMALAMALISLIFWHAPALVYWHGVKPLKSLFFSMVACLRNLRAYIMLGLGLFALTLVSMLPIVILGSVVSALTLPLIYMVYLFTGTVSSLAAYYAFKDSFISQDSASSSASEPEPAPLPPPNL